MFAKSLPSSEASKQDKPQQWQSKQWQAIAQLAWRNFAPPEVLGLGAGRTVEV